MLLAHPPQDEDGLRALVESEVTHAAAGLIGCRLARGGQELVIVETEAYHESEPASHGYGGTPRAAKLRRRAGSSYVYLSYGIHRLVNVVTGSQDVASAVLLRGGVVPSALGGGAVPGPGRLGTALAITLEDDGIDLLDPASPLRLLPAATGEDDAVTGAAIATGTRIGITKAVDLPWRFALAGSPGVSSPRL